MEDGTRMGLPKLTRRLTSKKELGWVICASHVGSTYSACKCHLVLQGALFFVGLTLFLGLIAIVLKAFVKWW